MKVLYIIPIYTIFAISSQAAEATFTVDANRPVRQASPILYGLMTEEINHSYDGGLYAELIQNRAFLDDTNNPVHWSVVSDEKSVATMSLDSTNPFNDKLTTSLRLTVAEASNTHSAGVANDGYWGIPVQPKTKYRATLLARADSQFSGTITVSIVNDTDQSVYATRTISGLTTNWKKYEVALKTGRVVPTVRAHFEITLNQPGTIWLGMVSLFPPTWNDQPNGFRKDLMQMLVDLHPKFLRCPGGNYLEGDTVESRFEWKNTIGPIEQRHGHAGPWGYRSTDGLGLLEFLEWCEAMRAEPVLAVYAGYSLGGRHVNPGQDLEPFVQDALDEIEYVTGDTNTIWGARRAKDGHPAPFVLHHVEIGNEDFFDKSGSYDARFAQFYDAIKSKHPSIKTISTIGDDQPEGKRVQSRKPDMMDGHYYRPSNEFLQMAPGYATNYDRNGPEIFVGEWAAYETSFAPWDGRSGKEPPTPTMKAALGDAAFMAAMERNSDLIKMQCYAPMLVNVNPGGRQWRPNLIGYDALSVYGSPSYYAIQMFSSNIGDEILSTTTTGALVQGSATRDSKTGEIILKLVNPEATEQGLNISLKGVKSVASKGEAITLSGCPEDTNSIRHPRNVIPVIISVRGVAPQFTYRMPAHSIVVLKLKSQW